jgi:hypothetical protein
MASTLQHGRQPQDQILEAVEGGVAGKLAGGRITEASGTYQPKNDGLAAVSLFPLIPVES